MREIATLVGPSGVNPDAPSQLTTWDLAFLRGLYATDARVTTQRSMITERVVRDMAGGATEPELADLREEIATTTSETFVRMGRDGYAAIVRRLLRVAVLSIVLIGAAGAGTPAAAGSAAAAEDPVSGVVAGGVSGGSVEGLAVATDAPAGRTSIWATSGQPGSSRVRAKSSLPTSTPTPISASRWIITSASCGRPLSACARASSSMASGFFAGPVCTVRHARSWNSS